MTRVTLSKLGEVISAVEGLDPVAVQWKLRHAREAGYIRTGGRGRGAQKLNSREIACALIAVNATRSAADVALAVERCLSCWSSTNGQFGDWLVDVIEAAIRDDPLHVRIAFDLDNPKISIAVGSLVYSFDAPFERKGDHSASNTITQRTIYAVADMVSGRVAA